MKELINLFEKYSLDKLQHRYENLYYNILKDNIDNIKNLLEIGIGTIDETKASNMYGYKLGISPNYTFGNSLRAWRDYLPNANIYGIDVDENTMFQEDRIKTFCSSSMDKNNMDKILSNIEKLDLIIDDGLHTLEANLTTLEIVFPYLKDGGYYVIEDVNERPDCDIVDFYKDERFLKIIEGREWTVHADVYPESTRVIVIKK
jgi:hypothetical protein